jgi:hypothetical protein
MELALLIEVSASTGYCFHFLALLIEGHSNGTTMTAMTAAARSRLKRY